VAVIGTKPAVKVGHPHSIKVSHKVWANLYERQC